MNPTRTHTFATTQDANAFVRDLIEAKLYVQVEQTAKLRIGQFKRRLSLNQPLGSDAATNGLVVEWCYPE